MFDKPSRPPEEAATGSERGPGPEDERIALRCNRRELQLLDSFVASGEFRSRSDLMRSALREFLRARALSAVNPIGAPANAKALLEVPVRLRAEEIETLEAYGGLVGNEQPLPDLLAVLVRRGELELKVSETVARARSSVHDAAKARQQIQDLGRSGADLERRGVVGR